MKLSDRLMVIANQIKTGETMADIGTDHGFLPLYLWENNISPKVIMADISKGSLKKAEDNCRLLHPEETEKGLFDLRLGNGIEVLENGEVDVVCIAGMGGILMTEILEADLEKTKSFKRLILQPRNNPGILRYWLEKNGFNIYNETLVREGKFICEIISAKPFEAEQYRSKNIEYGPWYDYPESLTLFKNRLTEEYLERALKREHYILESMDKALMPDKSQIKKVEEKITVIEKLLKNLER